MFNQASCVIVHIVYRVQTVGIMTLNELKSQNTVNHPFGHGGDTARAIKAMGSFLVILSCIACALFTVTDLPHIATRAWKRYANGCVVVM